MWRSQAEAEGLTLLEADNKTGYFNVYLNNPGKPKPYLAQVRRGGKQVSLGTFATAEEAALCIARSPEGRVAGLTLLKADDKTGYFGVRLGKRLLENDESKRTAHARAV